jgi:hypothetical protein
MANRAELNRELVKQHLLSKGVNNPEILECNVYYSTKIVNKIGQNVLARAK